MTRITLDSDLKSTLLTTNEPVEICDAGGNVVGVFTPRFDLEAYEREEPFDYQELQRRMREGTFISTDEVLTRLGFK
jgi:hypothetical protein